MYTPSRGDHLKAKSIIRKDEVLNINQENVLKIEESLSEINHSIIRVLKEIKKPVPYKIKKFL